MGILAVVSRSRINLWHKGTAWLLVAGILLQPVITYFATPWVALDSRGHYVLMCTLEGLKQVLVEDAAIVTEDEAPCPALELIKLVGSAKPVAPFQLPPVVLRLVISATPERQQQPSSRTTTNYAIRAPPIA